MSLGLRGRKVMLLVLLWASAISLLFHNREHSYEDI